MHGISALIYLVSSSLLQMSVQASPALAPNVDRRIDSSETTPEFVNLTRRIAYQYNIDCNVRPNVCENQCYYVFCKSGNWDITVERTPSNRHDSECAGYNRCSHGRKSGPPTGGWAINPNSGWSCDEQPKSSTKEGGAGSATRCMPAGENSGEGSDWSNFINGNTAATKNKSLKDQTSVTVALSNVKTHGFCAGYGGAGKTKCGTPATPPSTNEGPRQR
ncbi:hypothetical protein GALMADRAFT_215202 [Galerina marginata CBS 339.88]|uniref:Deoxyribonuclease NucA/NucB domain-containing protein n=1 Tax=Galerina marginata (strain CBS 339.88) TaxID=685588 RepID=A0A067SQW0_GALM3|nr:hypothetical protein GALMADRAFT_215202 [Galerina marginata CBS 339.88]